MDQLIIDFEVLAQVAKTTRTFKANEMIFKTGDHGSEFFVVREGSVGIYVGGRVVERIGTSGVFGEMAMVDALPRSAGSMSTPSGCNASSGLPAILQADWTVGKRSRQEMTSSLATPDFTTLGHLTMNGTRKPPS